MAPVKGGRDTPSNNLWVGNLSPHVSDSDLMSLFSKHGPVDSIASYPSRSYAFLYYRHVDDAKAALNALRGTVLRGSPLKIEFAKPAKPCKSLWVSGVSQAVTKEMLEEEFIKFGKIEEFKFIRDRNTAYIDYFRLEDAAKALKNMKGKRIGGDQIHVDFLRSLPTKRDQLADHYDTREGQFIGRGMGHIDTPLMRDEAMRNSNYYDPTNAGPQRQQFPSFEGQKVDGAPTNVLLICYPNNVEINEHMLHNAMILFGEIESLKVFSSRHCAFVEFRSMEEARRAKEGLQGRLFNDPRIIIMFSSSELALGIVYPELNTRLKGPRPSNSFNEPNALNSPSGYSPSTGPRNFQDINNNKGILGTPSWRGTSPAPKRPSRYDDQFPGEFKRSRTEASFISTKMDDRVLDSNQLYWRGSQDVRTSGTSQGHLDKDYIWRGLIAKGGNPVCRARCVPIGKGIESKIPEAVNCSARTGLDMLTKHYSDAIGFDIVFFLPDCEEDFASYTEFLNYLGGKDRAGVARFDNGTTLFLVPPSDFLTKVLKIEGPPRLYGVVLKFPQEAPISNSSQTQPFPTHYHPDEQARISQGEYNKNPQNNEKFFPENYFSVGSLPSAPKISMPPVSSVNISAAQSGVTLTPELIATLASFLPANSKSSIMPTPPLPHLPANFEFNNRNQQNWATDRQDSDQRPYQLEQMQEQYNPQKQIAQHQNYTTGINMPYNNQLHGNISAGSNSANSHVQDPPYYMPQPGGVSRPVGDFAISPQFHQQHQNEFSQNAPYGLGIAQGTTSSLGSYDSSLYPQNINSGNNNTKQAQISMVPPADKEKPEVSHNGQTQENLGAEVDKNQRYQSTLQFAANLLLQIQQQQKSGKGSGNNN